MPESDHDYRTDDELDPVDENGYPVILHCYSAYFGQVLKRRAAAETESQKLGPYGDWPKDGH